MTSRTRTTSTLAALGACLALASVTAADPVLELVPTAGPGQTFTLRVRNIGPTPAAGWQAFLEFDPSRLTFSSATYLTTRFGLPLISPIVAHANHIDIASGINPLIGQSPTGSDQDLAVLTFSTTGSGCLPQVRFRSNNPPTLLTDINGNSLGSLTLISPWVNCPADINSSGGLEVQDIFDFLNLWFAGDCRADFNGAGGLSVQDIFDFLSAWFAGCP
jgi:hypothetical protein